MPANKLHSSPSIFNLSSYRISDKPEMNVGHFAYKTFRLLDSSPTRHFAHSINVNTRE